MRPAHFSVLCFAISLFAAFSSPVGAADDYAVDAGRSHAKIAIRKLGVSTINGVFSDISGAAFFDKDNQSSDYLEISIGVASLKTGDSDRDVLMKSDDYFDARKHPSMKFKSARFRKTSGGKWEVTGDFSLHGVTKVITVELETVNQKTLPNGQSILTITTQFTIRRSDYGIRKNIPLVSDKVKINIIIEAVRK